MHASIKFFDWLLAGALACLIAATCHDAALAGCKPDHFKPPFFIKSMGVCSFDPETLSYAGTPVQQAMCLMRGMDGSRNLLPHLSSLPAPLTSRIGQTTGLPSRATLSTYLAKQGLEGDLSDYLWLPVSRAHNNDLDAPMARYFVIHDTSGPNYGHRAFPDDIDQSPKLNDLRNFYCPDGWGKAHVFISRTGELLVGHDYSVAWRETKFEQAAEFSGALQGLFLHNELIQPRRSVPGHGGRNDARSPDPAFTTAQYDRLALVYIIASVRAERWLVPAFHAAIDAQIPNGHDDPLNFDIDSFARSLDSLMVTLGSPNQIQAAVTTFAATDLLLNRDNALAELKQAIQLNPKMAEAYVVRGGVSRLKGNLNSALADFNQAIQLNPKLAEAYYGRGGVYFLKSNLDNALVDFNQAIQLNPKLAEAYYGRGAVYFLKGDLDNALADFNQAIQLNPKMAEAYVGRGDISRLKGNLADAFPDYDQAIQLNPELAEAYYGRGTIYFLKGDLDNASADFNQAIQLNPKMAENLHQMTGVVQNHTKGN